MSLEVYDNTGQLKTTGSGGSGAPTDSQYVTLATDAGLSDERVLTAGSGISVTDAGAGSTVTVALDVSPLSSITVDRANDVLPIEDVTDGSIKKITPDSLLPLTTKGDLQGFSTVPARVAVGTDGQYLKANSAAAAGVSWDTPGGTSPTTTKGDLIVNDGGGAASDDRLAVGTDGKVLTADSGAALGVSWQTPSGGGGDMTKLATQSGAAASYSFTSISGSYSHLKLIGQVRGGHADPLRHARIRFNGDTGASYDFQVSQLTGTDTSGTARTMGATSGHLTPLPGAGATAAYAGSFEAVIPFYAGTDFTKNLFVSACAPSSTTLVYLFRIGAHWRSTTAITQIDIFPDSGSFVAGSTITLYGIS